MKIFVIQYFATLCLALLGLGIALGVLGAVNLGLEWFEATSETAWYAYAVLTAFWFVAMIAALCWHFSRWGFNFDIPIPEIDQDDAKTAESSTTDTDRK